MTYSQYEPMHIFGTSYNMDRHQLEIFVSGCAGHPHCKGCHSPHTWDFRSGVPYTECLKDIESNMKAFPMIQSIGIFGGEPLDQEETDMNDLFSFLKTFGKPIILFTHYGLSEVEEKMPFLLTDCSLIKCGRYDPTCLSDTYISHGYQLASVNQVIYERGVDY